MLLLFLLAISSLACRIPTAAVSTATPPVASTTPVSFTETPVNTDAPVNTDTPVSTPTFTLSPSPDYTETPTQTATLGTAMVTPISENVNCRFGPSADYLATGALVVGEIVPITGKLADNSWWEIDNRLNTGKSCWVSAAVTTTSGDLAQVPVKSAPPARVINVSISVPETTIHGHCGGPNATGFEVSITTNGPASVEYHLEIYNGDDSLRNKTATETLSFSSADTQTFNPGGAYKTDCGDFYAIVFVTSPNNMSSRVDWSVVEP